MASSAHGRLTVTTLAGLSEQNDIEGRMDIQKVRSALESEPFQPFIIRLTDGRSIPVVSRECVAFGNTELVVSDGNDVWSFVKLQRISTLEEFTPARRTCRTTKSLSPHLTKQGKGELFANVIRARLGLLDFVSAVPQPDTAGEDLWIARSRTLNPIYRCQLKAICRFEAGNDRTGNWTRKYETNINLGGFLQAIHQPHFLLVIGLAVENDCDTIGDFRVVYVPGQVLQGSQYEVLTKTQANSDDDEEEPLSSRCQVNVRVLVNDSTEQCHIYHNRREQLASGDLWKPISKYIESPLTGMNDCSIKRKTSVWQVERDIEPFKLGPRQQKGYTFRATCPCCKTSLVATTAESPIIETAICAGVLDPTDM
jgi:hypothetical protein